MYSYCTLEDGFCSARKGTLADAIGASVDTVDRAIERLFFHGYIVDYTIGLRNKPHTYAVTPKGILLLTRGGTEALERGGMVKRFGQLGRAELYAIPLELVPQNAEATKIARREWYRKMRNEDIFTNKDKDPRPTLSSGGVSQTILTTTTSAGEEEEKAKAKWTPEAQRAYEELLSLYGDGKQAPPPVEEVERAPAPVEEKGVDFTPGENKSRWTNAKAQGWVTNRGGV
jgi:hypothetical protein